MKSSADCSRAPLSLRPAALRCLLICDADEKAQAVRALAACKALLIDTQEEISEPAGVPGRPSHPMLVAPRELPQRSAYTAEGRAALLHSVAHIEANAVNLALDACWRFSGMPEAYYRDWLRVASEEALHFTLLRDHLQAAGYTYGSFAAHDGLWEMARKTVHDVLARMALVPRLLEARGLDVNPLLREKFAAIGDTRSCEILDVILRDEIGHVAVGNHWFNALCAERGLQADAVFAQLLAATRAPAPRPPFNWAARERAGFSAQELARLAHETQHDSGVDSKPSQASVRAGPACKDA